MSMKTKNLEQGGGERGKRDHGAVAGFIVAAAAIVGAFILERGRIGDLGSLNAGLLVVGGTIGAVVIGTPYSVLLSSLRRCRGLFRHEPGAGRSAAEHIMFCAVQSKRHGLASIEQEAEAVKNGLLRRALFLVVDGVAPQEVRRQLQIEIAADDDRAEADARVFEQAGGYAPTIGIIGAVIGLIQVMRQLGNVDQVGHGIAAAFVSTLYGVALANLAVQLSRWLARIRSQARAEIGVKELILEGVTAVSEGMSLRLIRNRLETFLNAEGATPTKLAVSEMPPAKWRRGRAYDSGKTPPLRRHRSLDDFLGRSPDPSFCIDRRPSMPRPPVTGSRPRLHGALASPSVSAPKSEPPPKTDELAPSFDQLRKSLSREIEQGKMQVSMEPVGIVVSLKDQSYFKSGSDEIAQEALDSISKVASVIGALPNSVRLEGHSDSVPIHNSRFRDNWSLSAARSAAVLGLLESSFAIPAGRLAIAAYADNKPVAANESAEGRARNRRVDIVILSQRNL